MSIEKNWIMQENETQINYIRKNGWGLVVIYKVPEVSVITCKVVGTTYWVKSSKKGTHNKRCASFYEAVQEAKRRMEQFD
jgi:hypothetical protein